MNEVFQVVLVAYESVANQGKKTENRLWKRVVPSEFAWLPSNIAWSFYSEVPRRRGNCQYLVFYEAVDELVEAFILSLSTVKEVKDSDLLALGTTYLEWKLLLSRQRHCGVSS